MLRMRVLGGLTSIVVGLACAACTDEAPPAPEPEPVSALNGEAIDPASLKLPRSLHVDEAIRLPAGLRPWSYGARVGERYLGFGVAPDGVDPDKGQQPPDQFGRYAVLDLTTKAIVVRDTVHRGAFSYANVFLPVGGVEHLLRLEGWRAADAATACPEDPAQCWHWAIYARSLPDGPEQEIDHSERPGPQVYFPRPKVDSASVVWQSIGRTTSTVTRWRPDTGIVRLGGSALPPGELSLAADAWIGTAPRWDDQLVRVPFDGSPASVIDLPKHSSDGVVRGTRFVYRQELPEEGVELRLGDVARPEAAKPIHTVSDIFWLTWATDDMIIISTTDGIRLVRVDGKWSRLPGGYQDHMHIDRDRITMLRTVDGRAVVTVASIKPARP